MIRPFLFISLVAASFDATAEDLVQVYRDAQRYDAVYSGARYALQAGREKLPQGRSLLLPTLGLTGSVTRSRIDSEARDPATAPNLNFLRQPRVDGYALAFAQPVFRLQNWYQFEQGEQQVRQAEAVFGQATQDLIVRVSQAYFDVLSAQDTLGLVRAQKAAISEQLAQAKRNFEVGTAT
ncbi:MAG TPA: TolC family protein, partial [Burkholderiales bacterium]|nr:TolC family protein [Burkholderiales bacterium]